MLKKREWASITIAELSRAAGYSVGAFYTRFRSKDEFFDALVVHQLKARKVDLERLYATYNNDDFIDELIKDVVHYLWILYITTGKTENTGGQHCYGACVIPNFGIRSD